MLSLANALARFVLALHTLISPFPSLTLASLMQQMICLERLDGRALTLPGDVIPSLDLTRAMLSSMVTGMVLLGPYLLTIWNHLSSDFLCLS